MAAAPPIHWDSVVGESVALLRRLVQFDTTNPPGNETACVEWVASELAKDGIESQVFESAPGRGNLVARLRATGPIRGGPLLLFGHVDVVPAVAAEWRHGPFSADLVDGEVWGRGTLDMKGLATIYLTVVRLLARQGGPVGRDLLLMLNADVEASSAYGAQWMVDHHWDLIACEAALTEGSGPPIIEVQGQRYHTYGVDEKWQCWFTLTARGRGGHAARPHDDQAVVHLATAVHALGTTKTPVHLGATFRACTEALASAQPEPVKSLLLRALDPVQTDAALDGAIADASIRDLLRAAVRNTLTPTIVQGGSKINTIPTTASASVDCRALPGYGPDEVRQEVAAILQQAGVLDKVELDFSPALTLVDASGRGPAGSPVQHPLVDCLRRGLATHAPGVPLVPAMITGATDGRFLRQKGSPVYGFRPLPDADFSTQHGIDERLPVQSLAWATRLTWDIVADYCQVPSSARWTAPLSV
ncbi:MAG: M20/M25/M40 family metallo-hydrolase [Chloroflexi bacterium]|nr:M20/M25/M40 family metallo-hydrolase [Chloroflexota bacterium]